MSKLATLTIVNLELSLIR